MGRYDIVLKGGTVIDPVNGRNGVMDIGIRGGKIAVVKENIDASEAGECFPVQQLLPRHDPFL